MITTAANSTSESLPTCKPSSATSGEVIYREFILTAQPTPLRNTISVNEITKEYESDPVKAELLRKARQQFASDFHEGDESFTALRLRAGLSQVRLAELVKTSQPHIAKIEKGTNDPSTDMIARLASALEVDEVSVFNAIRSTIKSQSNG